jgi:hypothetical protein
MTEVVDNPDGTRTFSLEVNGTLTALPDTQTARVTRASWMSPTGTDGQVFSRSTTVRLNGEVVQDDYTISGEQPSGG